MDNIKVGDFVEVVKWPCCGKWIGHTFIVGAMGITPYPAFICASHGRKAGCGHSHLVKGQPFVADSSVPHEQGYLVSCPAAWVKRLPPLSDETEVIREREIENADHI